MSPKSAVRATYKILRTILFTAFFVVVGVFLILYVALSIPAVQSRIKGELEKAASEYIGASLTAQKLSIRPFNEVRLEQVRLLDPQGHRVADIEKVGAGINLWRLMADGKIEINYAEIIGLDARIWQERKDAPLNIQFLIDAFKPKDKNKPPTKFDLKLRNIVIRKSQASFDRLWQPRLADTRRIDFNHLKVTDLRADVAIPLLKNDDFEIDLRRLALRERSGLTIETLSLFTHITAKSIDVKNLKIKLPGTDIRPSDIHLSFNSFKEIPGALEKGTHILTIDNAKVSPSDFAPFLPALSRFEGKYALSLDAEGNSGRIRLEDLKIASPSGNKILDLAADVSDPLEPEKLALDLKRLALNADRELIDNVLAMVPSLKGDVRSKIAKLGDVTLEAGGKLSLRDRSGEGTASVATAVGDLDLDFDGVWRADGNIAANLKAATESLDLGSLLDNKQLGLIAARVEGQFSGNPKNFDASAKGEVPFVDFKSYRISNIRFDAAKEGKGIKGKIEVNDPAAIITADADCLLAGAASRWNLTADIGQLRPALVGLLPKYPGASLKGYITADVSGNNPDNLLGEVRMSELDIRPDADTHLPFENITVTSALDEGHRSFELDAGAVYAQVSGEYTPSLLVPYFRNIVAEALPALVTPAKEDRSPGRSLDFLVRVEEDRRLFDFLKFPMKPLSAVEARGNWREETGVLTADITAPYLLKGTNKLVKNFGLALTASREKGIDGKASINMPMKNDRANFSLAFNAAADNVATALGWKMDQVTDNQGNILLNIAVAKNLLTGRPDVFATIDKSGFRLSGSEWTINPATVKYADNTVTVNDLKIWHALQYIDINGKASKDPADMLTVDLAGIDLSYIFDVLNINYVDFGGVATGKAYASQLFSGAPVLEVKRLDVKNFSYNNAPLGDAVIESHWDNAEKMVAINADIDDHKESTATVRGGVYVTRDSLSFDFNARKINVALLKPFMSGFTSSVEGQASGHVKLYGTFKDIDLGGAVLADTITIRCDQTNVYYSGSDSVFFSPGRISIPHIRVYDRYGHSGLLRGEVTHNFLHDASFSFDLTDARQLLCYDTDARSGDFWYGRVFANGSAALRGRPGLINLDINMTTAPNSTFTFELDENETAVDYTFLTFSDRRKEREMAELKVEESLEEKFSKKVETKQLDKSDIFAMNLGLTVTPECTLTLVMDPKAGDKIVAHGQGGIRMAYNSESDVFNLYGKYTLDSGNYNFSLQDLILRNFKIERGSSISFNGDPMQGVLDITASYRVNTSLTDLDSSFGSDPDLKRTSVPVDALLKVTGDIQSPEIAFDLRLPTVTAEVERKVKSIVSTEDMMNRQVIYLLVLNRFYSPEYTGSEGQGGELASVASSTISSQISNIIGSITDKFTLAPQFRSERSDFSDLEVDVALSSRLFNNRLLINGVVGYRDKSTSQSTFIGDFDLEYLLNRSGSLRLKAYNHFNDASYYLKSALTTQGLGIIYRKDFDNFFKFLRPRRKNKKQ